MDRDFVVRRKNELLSDLEARSQFVPFRATWASMVVLLIHSSVPEEINYCLPRFASKGRYLALDFVFQRLRLRLAHSRQKNHSQFLNAFFPSHPCHRSVFHLVMSEDLSLRPLVLCKAPHLLFCSHLSHRPQSHSSQVHWYQMTGETISLAKIDGEGRMEIYRSRPGRQVR